MKVFSFTLIVLSWSDSATLWTVAKPSSSVYGFPRQEYWSGLPSPRDLPDTGMEPASPSLASRLFTTEPPEKSFFPLIEPQFSRAERNQLQFFSFFATLDFLAAKGGQFWSRKNKWEFPVWHVQSLEIITHILITRKMLNTLKINNFS